MKKLLMKNNKLLMKNNKLQLSENCCCGTVACEQAGKIELTGDRTFRVIWNTNGTYDLNNKNNGKLQVDAKLAVWNTCGWITNSGYYMPSDSYNYVSSLTHTQSISGQMEIILQYHHDTGLTTVVSASGTCTAEGIYEDKIVRTGSGAETKIYKRVIYTDTYNVPCLKLIPVWGGYMANNVSGAIGTTTIDGKVYATSWSVYWTFDPVESTGTSYEYVGEGYQECLEYEYVQGDCLYWNPENPEECLYYDEQYNCVNELIADSEGYITRPYTGEYKEYGILGVDGGDCGGAYFGSAGGIFGATSKGYKQIKEIQLQAGCGSCETFVMPENADYYVCGECQTNCACSPTYSLGNVSYYYKGEHWSAEPRNINSTTNTGERYTDTYGSSETVCIDPQYTDATDMGVDVNPDRLMYSSYYNDSQYNQNMECSASCS